MLSEVKNPVLVIHGINDEYGSPKHPDMIVETIGAFAQLEITDDASHLPRRMNRQCWLGIEGDAFAEMKSGRLPLYWSEGPLTVKHLSFIWRCLYGS